MYELSSSVILLVVLPLA